MDYLKLLEHSYATAVAHDECPPESRLEYLGDQIFDFTTYDERMSAFFADKAIDVCEAISNKQTFSYIRDHENYTWFLLMCNMPFFSDRIEWGTSIRGAWWEASELEVLGLYDGDEQILMLNFTREEWEKFVSALVIFARAGNKPSEGG